MLLVKGVEWLSSKRPNYLSKAGKQTSDSMFRTQYSPSMAPQGHSSCLNSTILCRQWFFCPPSSYFPYGPTGGVAAAGQRSAGHDSAARLPPFGANPPPVPSESHNTTIFWIDFLKETERSPSMWKLRHFLRQRIGKRVAICSLCAFLSQKPKALQI